MISIRDMYSGYNDKTILHEINLEIPDKGVTCILGPNGSGKTTLLKTLLGILKYRGSITIDGRELMSYHRRELSRIIAYSSSLESVSLLSLTIREALLIARYPISRGFWESRLDYEEVTRIASMLHLEKLLDRRLNELSSGELQRVAIALALVKDPKYILLDEPDSHIDVGYRSHLVRLIRDLGRNKSVIVATHDILFAQYVADTIVLMNNGRIVYNGRIEDIINAQQIIEEIYNVKTILIRYDNTQYIIPIYK